MTDKDNLKSYFLAYAKSTLIRSKEDKSKYYCPSCDKKTIHLFKKEQRFKCFNPSCEWNNTNKKGGDIFDLVELQTGIVEFKDKISYLERYIEEKKLKKDSSSVPEQIKQDQKKSNSIDDIPDMEALNKNFLSSEKALKQIQSRKISNEMIERMKFGFGKSTIIKRINVIFIPFPESDYFIEWNYNSSKNNLPKYLNPAERQKLPFNYKIIGRTEKPIFIVEGIFDSLVIQQSGFESVAICGSGFEFLFDYIKKNKPKNNLILLFDNDEQAGKEFQKQFSSFLKEQGIIYFNSNIMEYMQEKICPKNNIKDSNEAYKMKPDLFVKLLRKTEEKANYYFSMNNEGTKKKSKK